MKKSICMLIASAILVTGVFLAGCTQDSGNTSQQSTGSQVASPDQSDQPAITRDRPAFNQSAAPNGTLPSGMMMDRTPPSGPPTGWCDEEQDIAVRYYDEWDASLRSSYGRYEEWNTPIWSVNGTRVG